jgi:mannose-6-phosphate isomerase-like protein (cupin superfamily)
MGHGGGWATARMDEVSTRDPSFGEGWHSIRHHFGISAFGVNASEGAAGAELVEPHDEAKYRQEELFLVVRGRVRFTCDGTDVELGPGDMLYARPEVERRAVALQDDTLVFMVGGAPGEPYEVPDWDRE